MTPSPPHPDEPSLDQPLASPTGAPSAPPRASAAALGDRALAPDIARGLMLLVIALGNAHQFLHDRPIGVRSYPVEQSGVDRAVTLAQMLLVDGRGYPLFAALFGYGMVQLIHRRTASGATTAQATGLVRRRGAWMVLFGFLHALLLFGGDIIAAYGLVGLVFAGVLAARGRTLPVVAWLMVVPFLLLNLPVGLSSGLTFTSPSYVTPEPLFALVARVVVDWLPGAPLQALSVAGAVLLGGWAARSRLLDEPERHRRLLARTAMIGIPVGVLGGLPFALVAAGLVATPSTPVALALATLHGAAGLVVAAGFLGLVGLLVARSSGAGGPLQRALIATGQRSMTCYVLQSVIFVPLLAAWGLGLGDRIGVAGAALLALGTWVVGVLLATGLARAGRRGPLESALRRLTYGRSRTGPAPAT